jgi:glycosyltransferase involved in cell wall biosynthesis
MRTSILLPSYLRSAHLDYTLASIFRQDLSGLDYEAVILNDGIEDDTADVANGWRSRGMNIRYVFTGQRNKNGLKPRQAGFALNVGIQLALGDIVILSCSEVYHLNNSLRIISHVSESDPLALATPRMVFDDDGGFWCRLQQYPADQPPTNEWVNELASRDAARRIGQNEPFIANPSIPYFMAVRRDLLLEIGGYDEDFTGRSADDSDLIGRLQKAGCNYRNTSAEVVHLYHRPAPRSEWIASPEYQHNLNLYRERHGIIHRNVGRPWGVLG